MHPLDRLLHVDIAVEWSQDVEAAGKTMARAKIDLVRAQRANFSNVSAICPSDKSHTRIRARIQFRFIIECDAIAGFQPR